MQDGTVKLTSPNLNYAIVVGAIVLVLGGLLVPGFPLWNKEKQAIICEVCKKLALSRFFLLYKHHSFRYIG